MKDDVSTATDLEHAPVERHRHKHDRWCGHVSLQHEDHLDFLHDGHVHHPCTDHVDDISATVGHVHLPHAAHMHVHQPGCGHESVSHDDHIDFMHGDHRHAQHQSHYDEH